MVTDHKIWKWLVTIEQSAERLARWMMKLQQHNYTVRNQLEAQHQNADALSRIDVDRFIQRIFQESNIRERVKEAQIQDLELIKEMENNEKYIQKEDL